eukprot:6236191-Pyramimonas_sp.AAC.1
MHVSTDTYDTHSAYGRANRSRLICEVGTHRGGGPGGRTQEELCKHAPHRPHVYFGSVFGRPEEQLRRPVGGAQSNNIHESYMHGCVWCSHAKAPRRFASREARV